MHRTQKPTGTAAATDDPIVTPATILRGAALDLEANGFPDCDEIVALLRACADDYVWDHADPDDVETFADDCAWREEIPTRDGFLAWLAAR